MAIDQLTFVLWVACLGNVRCRPNWLCTRSRWFEGVTTHLGRLLHNTRFQEDQTDRLRLVVQTLDGFLQNAVLPEIGIGLFGTAVSKMAGEDGYRHLKDPVHRAIARGHGLMNVDI